jgi:N6-L-threonylcarbamoyladenine synthase
MDYTSSGMIDDSKYILGIESSCDDTGMALIELGTSTVSASLLKSQLEAHTPFGGVVPEIAARKHLDALAPLFEATIREAKIQKSQIEAIATTEGPGLMGPLLVGTCFAQGLASSLSVPLLGINHIHAHIWGAFLSLPEFKTKAGLEDLFPSLAMVVSGGHCNLYRMNNPTDFSLVGWTRDDAAGECFDKVGKLLGLPYPGGPKIEALAKTAKKTHDFDLGRTRIEGLQFSFSGLKTQIARTIKDPCFDSSNPEQSSDLCWHFQNHAFGQITGKLKGAFESFGNIKNIVIAGGVAANQRFRELCKEAIPDTNWIFPDLKHCTDNGAMVAALGSRQLLDLKGSNRGQETPVLEPYPRYSFAEFTLEMKNETL